MAEGISDRSAKRVQYSHVCRVRRRALEIALVIVGALFLLFSSFDIASAVTWSSFSAADLLGQGQVVTAATSSSTNTTNGGEDPTQGVYFLDPSNTGAATSSVPIQVPPGRGGLTPKLGLTYSSNRGNGIVGVGWDITMGAIERSTKRGVNYSGEDFVVVSGDGSSELAVRPDRGSNYFGEAIERSFSNYFFDSANNRWIVTTKDGTKYYYGQSSSSRQYNQSGDVFKWCLDEIVDTKGNYLTVTYVTDQGELYLNTISYAGNSNAGLNPTDTVRFYYDKSRTDDLPMYRIDSLVVTAWRLKAIDVITTTAGRVGTYELTYMYGNTGQSLLTSVQQYGTNAQIDSSGNILSGTSLPPMVFSWDDTPAGTATMMVQDSSVPNPPSAPWGVFLTGDYNGDGKMDVFHFWQTSPGQVDGNDLMVNVDDLTTGTSISSNLGLFLNSTAEGQLIAGFVTDFDGDGKSDIVLIYMHQDTNDPTQLYYLTIRVFTVTVDGTSYELKWYSGYTVGRWHYSKVDNDHYPVFVAADFEGTGKTGIVQLWNNGGNLAIDYYQSDGTSYTWTPVTSNAGIRWSDNDTFLTGDVNGDGMTDLIHLYDNGSGGLGINVYGGLWTSQPDVNTGPQTLRFYALDVNGDGRTDIVQLTKDANGILGEQVFLSTGTGYTWVGGGSLGVPADGQFLVGDVNGDGKGDIMQLYPNTTNGDLGMRFFSVSTDHFYVDDMHQGYNGSTDYDAFLAGDYNGDGKTDIIQMWNNNGTADAIAYKSDGHVPNLLSNIQNSLGGDIGIQYTPSSAYANTNLPFVVQTVSSRTFQTTDFDGNATSSTTNYVYINGLYSAPDREFRGFEYFAQLNPDNTAVLTWYHQDDIYKGLPYLRATGSNTPPSYPMYSAIISSYQSTSPCAGVYVPLLSERDDLLFDGSAGVNDLIDGVDSNNNPDPLNGTWTNYPNRHAVTSYLYDTYGNVKETDYQGDVAVSGDEKHELRSYAYELPAYSSFAGRWMVSIPQDVGIYDGNWNKKAETSFTSFDTTTGNPLTKVDWLNLGGSSPVTTFTYYPDGNLHTMTAPDPTGLGNVSTFTYDSGTETFPASIVNGLNQQTQFNFDVRFGKISSVIDPNGNQTNYDRDDFGRLTTELDPSTGLPAYKWEETLYDGFGRKIKKTIPGPGAAGSGKDAIAVGYKYDAMGRLGQVSYPYFEDYATGQASETPRWTTYSYYDPLGRLTGITNPDNTTTSKAYYLNEVATFDENGHGKVETMDAYNRVVEVDNYTGTGPYTSYATTQYSYDVLGNLTGITDAHGNTTTMAYDSLSRKISMGDPDMGNWTYTYYSDGSLKSQTDAMGQTTDFTYDKLGRVLTKGPSSGGTDVTYTYDEVRSDPACHSPVIGSDICGNIGRLTSVAYPSDSSREEAFNYDTLGRIVQTTRTVDGQGYSIGLTYDIQGRLINVQYPDSENVSYAYDDAANLTNISSSERVSGDNAQYAAFSGYNALGQVGSVRFGNGVTTTYQYRSDDNRLQSLLTTNPSGNHLQDLSYSYFPNGDINTITDNGISGNGYQTFQYDELDRLTTANSSVYGNLSYQYDQIGNLTYNSQMGSYTYGTQPHAALQVGPNTYTYNSDGSLLGGGGYNITYNPYNMPASINGNTFVYDYANRKVKENDTVFVGQLFECQGPANGSYSNCTKYIFGPNDRVALRNSSGVYFYHTDHLGSTGVVTDSSGNTAEQISYYPFGKTRQDSGSLNTRYKFTGQEKDPETGLYNYIARLYDPVTGRFLSADSFVQDPNAPQTLNRYSYAGNDPVLNTDPTGHFSCDKYGCYSGDSDFLGGYSGMFGGGNGWSWSGSGFDASDSYFNFGDNSNSNWFNVTISLSTGIYDPLYSNSWGVLRSQPNEWNVSTPIHLGGSSANTDNWAILDSQSVGNMSNSGISAYQINQQRRDIDWVSASLGGISSAAALVALDAPTPGVKLVAGSVGLASTVGSVFNSVYRYKRGTISGRELALEVSLDLTPFLGSKVAGTAGRAAFEVIEHQIGLGEAIKSIFYDPNE